ncbi:MAG: ferrous iron transport protein A [Planctomycetes bacterium]|nr:ferrous iron transport protein A [Planctomycetota bacterium]
MNGHQLTLKDLQPGDEARVLRCSGDGAVFQRLCEMGFVEGAPLRMVRYAPFGDPVEVELSHYHLSLRKAEAGMIEVERRAGEG